MPMPLGDTFLPWDLGILLFTAGELDEARSVLERAAEIASVGRIRAWVVDSLGIVAYRRGDRLEARRLFRQALVALANYRDLRGCAMAVEHMASVAGALESWRRAARLLGAAEMLYDQSSQVAFPAWQLEPDRIAAACLQGLGEKSYAAAVAAGRAMSVERAVHYALEPDSRQR